MRRLSFKTLSTVVAVLISLMVLLMVGSSLVQLQRKSHETGLQVARQALERTVMQCYALEGAYPPNLDYLVEHYGLVVNEDRYVYLFEPGAANIFPIIKIQDPGSVTE